MLQRLADELARDCAKQIFLVDGIADMSRARALKAYFVRGTGGELVVLADTQMAAAELVAETEGSAVAVSCLLGRHRVVRLPQGGWAVAALPRWLGFLGRTCEHGDHVD